MISGKINFEKYSDPEKNILKKFQKRLASERVHDIFLANPGKELVTIDLWITLREKFDIFIEYKYMNVILFSLLKKGVIKRIAPTRYIFNEPDQR